MPFLASLREDAAPPMIFKRYPEIYRHWAALSEALMNGPSPLGQDERELLLAYAAGVMGCEFVAVAHAEVAYARGIPRGLVEAAVSDPENAQVSPPLRALLRLVRELMLAPGAVDPVRFHEARDAGWNQQALDFAITIAARAAFMVTFVQGFGFAPLTREAAAYHALRRVEKGYVNLYPQFRKRE